MDSKLQFSSDASVEIIVHCWKYSRLLCYQLSSLLLHPPTVPTQITIFASDKDEPTKKTVEFFKDRGVDARIWLLRHERLFRRSIGRNLAARATEASVAWFADCDYCFGPGAIDSLAGCLAKEALYRPKNLFFQKNHALGDAYIDRLVPGEPEVVAVNDEDFLVESTRKSIGGIQIVSGEVARTLGYLETWRRGRYQADVLDVGFQRCVEDGQYRKHLKQHGIEKASLSIPNVYRIRHTGVGREQPDLIL